MKICYLGIYDNADQRNNYIKEGLRRTGFTILECNEPITIKSKEIKNKFQLVQYKVRITKEKIKSYYSIIKKYLVNNKECRWIIIGFPSEYDVLIAKILTIFSKKKIICDFFNPNYYTAIIDRSIIKKKSLTALKLWILDKISYSFSDYLLADTIQHKALFKNVYKMKLDKFIIVPPAADNKIFKRKNIIHKNKKFTLFFRPTFSPPLTGIKYVIGAMRLLEKENITLYLASDENTKKELIKYHFPLPKGIKLVGWLKYKDLPYYTQLADACITGHFGQSIKGNCVVNNKTIEAISLGKPIIINAGEANKQIFTDKVDCLMVPKENPEELAKAILFLKNNPFFRKKIGNNAYRLYKKNYLPEKAVESLVEKIKFGM